MFTLAVFDNLTEFEADIAENKLTLYCPIKIICAMFFGLSFLAVIAAALWVSMSTGLAHN
jgi:hypothetical protein